ncbi:hypothetical protein DFH28DRAFT_1133827 [Melampsora americana]|nr:hypothetical protein DFH28DRAFT_1133827 [Melampsora americana]
MSSHIDELLPDSRSESAESTNTAAIELPTDPHLLTSEPESVPFSGGPSAAEASLHVQAVDTEAETLHSICGLTNVLLEFPFELHGDSLAAFGQGCLPVIPASVNSTSVLNPNATIFAIRFSSSDDVATWSFQGQPACISVTNKFIHSWDFRATYKGKIHRGDCHVPLGVRAFYQHDRPLSTYLGIAQTYFHVAVHLQKFRDDLEDRMTLENTTDIEWETLQSLRENAVGLMHHGAHSVHRAHSNPPLTGFTAEELVEGPRERYTRDDCFLPTEIPPHHHYLSRPIRLLLEALSHWSYERSDHTSIISGFQGVGPVITEAVVHDVTAPWTIGNFRRSALDRFPLEHVCGKFCRVLGNLPTLPLVTSTPTPTDG